MKPGDLKIGTQLALGLGIILSLVIVLGIIVAIQEESMWQETSGLYEHPLQVRRAVGEIEADILVMHREMKDLILSDNEQEREQIVGNIDSTEADAYQQFNILNDRYLGSKSDIDTLYNDFVQWKSIREETIRLLRAGNSAEALNRTRPNGSGGEKVNSLMADIQKISDFSKGKGDQFYENARKQKDDLHLQLIVVICIILLLSLWVSYFLIRKIRDPLKELTFVTEQYRKGSLNARSEYDSTNEIGLLSASFNTLADSMQMELLNKEKTVKIAEVIIREEDLQSFCRELLITLLELTSSQIGAVYLLNPQKTDFTLFDSIGLTASCRTSWSAHVYEGEFGPALATHQIQRVTDIPKDTAFAFSTVTGDLLPQEIITIPILSGKEVVAIISLASILTYPAPAIRLIHDIWVTLTARFNGVLAVRQIHEFSEKLEHQNVELTEKSRELLIQADELREHNMELEVQKKQLNEANRLKSVFLSNMSHELRTPLNSVIALSGVLSRRLHEKIPEEEYSYLDIIERNGRSLLRLINDILDLSRIEAGREEVNLSMFSVTEIVDSVIETFKLQAQEKGIALHNLVDSDILRITSDFEKCRHILENLVANAVKFTGEGTVKIRAMVAGIEMHISVTDTGIGISEDQIPFIFDEFRQADDSVARKYDGTGLGLSIAEKYAKLLSGSISVSSIPGKGSTFTLTLPLTFPQQTETFENKSEHLGRQITAVPSFIIPGYGKTILVVEDSEPAIIQLKDLLTEQGYRIRVARNGKEAIEEIRREIPDAVILDLMMPEVDGFSVLRNIRSDEKTALLPVLILTAKHITKEELAFLKGNNIHQLIQKGDINRTGLLAAVKSMVSEPTKKKDKRKEKQPKDLVLEKPVILIVEDNEDNMITIKALLMDRYTVFEAMDGLSGLELARIHKPDLILLDISLPGMDGFQTLKAIRKEEALQHIPVIALTARAMKGDREEILSQGFDGYISKPLDDGILEKTIQRILYDR